MTPEWERVRALFHTALDANTSQQALLLREARVEDEAVAREVASLLVAHRAEPAFLETPIVPAAFDRSAARRSDTEPNGAERESGDRQEGDRHASDRHATGVRPMFASGDRLGAFEILAPAGHGGMGEVYKARDLRLDRIVAIKIVADRHGDDPRARTRFEREARAISRLSHPHICTLHDVGVATVGPDQADVPFLVMEFLEGRTLADRLREGPLAPAEALRLALAIVQALEAAHAHGIVHRDLKPANIMLTGSGVKLLDFGLAQLRAGAIAPPSGAGGPAFSAISSLSTRGVILGTLRYMSPEQLRGEPTDLRSDIFSFGVVLFETLMGRPPFDERDDASAIAAVLTRPAPRVVTRETRLDQALTAIVGRCLEKDPARRYPGMADLREVLAPLVSSFAAVQLFGAGVGIGASAGASANSDAGAGAGAGTASLPSSLASSIAPALQGFARRSRSAIAAVPRLLVSARQSTRLRRWLRITVAIAIIAISARAGFLVAGFHLGAARGPAARVSILPPDGVRIDVVQISPDGKQIAMTGWTPEGSRIWLRPLDAATPRAVPGTLGARGPLIWSPDSRRLAFIMGETLHALDIVTGATQTLGDVGVPLTGTWGSGDVILFDAGRMGRDGIWRIPASGGAPKQVMAANASGEEIALMFPHFLPDGEHFLYSVHSMNPQVAGVYLGSLDRPKHKRILPRATPVLYLASGHLLFAGEGSLLAQRFDPEEGVLSGDAVPIMEGDTGADMRPSVKNLFNGTGTVFSASQTGTIVHASSTSTGSQLAWHDRDGRRLRTIGEPGEYSGFALSRDDARVVAARAERRGRPSNLWMFDQARGTSTRMTFAATDQFDPRWSPDGTRIVVSATRSGPEPAESATRPRDPSTRDGDAKGLVAIAFDGGESLLYRDPTRSISVDDWSPDGRWLLYHVDRDRELLAVPVSGDQSSPRLLWRSPSSHAPDQARFSPDGRWVAYHSEESGHPEVYVTRFPGGGERWRVSSDGGVQPLWRHDGRELFYLGLDGRIFAVPLGTNGGDFQPSAPRPLFQTTIGPNALTEQFAVDRTGTKFLLLEPDPTAATPVINIILNWQPARTTRAGS